MVDLPVVVCYGDSNTHGADGPTGRRHRRDVRWPGVVARALDGRADVIEEGLGGRTTIWDEPFSRGAQRAHVPGPVPRVACAGRRPRDHARHERPQGDLPPRRGRDRGGRREPGRPGPRQRRPVPTEVHPRFSSLPRRRSGLSRSRPSCGDSAQPGRRRRAWLPTTGRSPPRRAPPSSMRAHSSRPIRSTGSTSTRPRTGCWVPPSRRRSTRLLPGPASGPLTPAR